MTSLHSQTETARTPGRRASHAGVSIALGLVALLAGAPRAAAQVAVSRASTTVLRFAGFGGSGFAPAPTTAQLDSDTWIPVGNAPPDTAIGYGGVCTGPRVCARGTAAVGITLLAGIYAISSPVLTGNAVGLQSGATVSSPLHPGGLRLRILNADTATVRGLSVRAVWASRHLLPPTDDTLTVGLVDCVTGAALGTSAPARGPADPAIGWTGHDDTFDLRGVGLVPGALGCIQLTVGEEAGGRDVIAIGELDIVVPGGSCGNGVVETGEECDGSIGGGPCACDAFTCTFPPIDLPCEDDDGNPCTGLCGAGVCRNVARSSTELVPACDSDGDPCTFEACESGTCVPHVDCTGLCDTCDSTALSCGIVSGCCTDDGECPGLGVLCRLAICNSATHTCEVVPDPACVDGAASLDASISSDGGPMRPDAAADGDSSDDGSTSLDASTPRDGGGSSLDGDVTTDPTTSFGGGGGCHCAAAGRGPTPGAFVITCAALALLTARRRRRAAAGNAGRRVDRTSARVRRPRCGAAASSWAGRSGRCTRSDSAAGSPGVRARLPRSRPREPLR